MHLFIIRRLAQLRNARFVTLSLLLLMAASISHAFDPSNYATNTEQSSEMSAQAEPDFLKVHEAFRFSEKTLSNGLELTWGIEDEYFLYYERFKFKALSEGVTIGEPKFSTQGKAKNDPYFGEVHVIHKTLTVFLPISLAAGVRDAEIQITYQGCAEAGLCYAPARQKIMFIPPSTNTNSDMVPAASISQASDTPTTNSQANALTTNNIKAIVPTEELSLPSEENLEDASGVFNFIQTSSLPTIIGIFFLLGLGLTFTPCVFPMIPIITSIIAGQNKPTVMKSLVLSSTYVLGMAITYASAGVVTGMLGAGANVQAALQDPILLSVFAAIFVLLALAMFGLYELQLPAFIRDRLNNTSQNLSGGHIGSVFLIGALSALVVSPCVSAPLAGALLYISATADAVIGGASLFALGLGMGVPLILISVGGGKFFPKAGAWMDAVKGVFGVMLLAVAIWLLSRFVAAELIMLLWAILFGLSATQMGAFDSAASGWPRILKGLGLLLALYSALLAIGAASGGTNPLKPLDAISSNSNGALQYSAGSEKLPFENIYTVTGLNKQLGQAKGQQLPTMVDFYADWCISCKIMEDQVFPLAPIKQRMERFHLVKADVTENDAGNQELMETFGLFGPPSILFFDESGNELKALRIVGEVTATDFQKRLDAALSET